MEVYKLEDDACADWTASLTELYNLQIHPFLELREIANDNMKHCKVTATVCLTRLMSFDLFIPRVGNIKHNSVLTTFTVPFFGEREW